MLQDKRDVEVAISPQSSTNPFSDSLPSSGTNADVADLFGSNATPATTSPHSAVPAISSTNPFASAMAPVTSSQPTTGLN